MKKLIAIFFIILTVLTLASCGNTYNKVTAQLSDSIPSGFHYTEAQIEEVQRTHNMHGHFNGDIVAMADYSTLGEKDGAYVELYIYVYDFDMESDAQTWYRSVSASWPYAKCKGTVVVYGTNSIIEDLDM